VAVPSVVPPSLKVNTPVGVPVELVTLAVNVTACPTLLGLIEDRSEIVVVLGAFTEREAEAVPPFPASFDVTAPVVLFLAPGAVPVTLIEKVHDAFAASVAPARLTFELPEVAVMAPPAHEPVRPLGVETSKPVGNASVNPTPVNDADALGFVIVKVRETLPLTEMEAAPNISLMVGGESAITVTVAVFEGPPPLPLGNWFDVTGPVVLLMTPAVVPTFTLTENVQEALAASIPPVRLSVPAATATAPPHAPAGTLETARPAGNASENPTPVSGKPFGLLIVKVREVVPLTGTEVAPNALLMVGATPVTVMVAVFEGLPTEASFDVTGLAVLLMTPVIVPTFTLTETVQEAFAASVPPARLRVLVPTVRAPPHVVAGVPETARPAGNGSENPTPVSGKPFGLLIVKLREVVPLAGTEVAANALLMVGGAPITVMVAVFEGLPLGASFDVTGPVVLLMAPAVDPTFTLTVNVQEALAVSVPPAKLRV
jgi:hypothetical protein